MNSRRGVARAVVALTAAAVLFLVGFAWRPILASSFQSDDYARLAERNDGTPLSRWTDHAFGAFARGDDVYWRPGWHAMNELGYALGGMDPAPWFALALALHLLLVLALFAALLGWSVPVELAAAGALAFGVAPGYTEAVAWLSAAMNVLPCALLLLAAGVAILRWLEGAKPRFLATALALFSLSLAFKESGYHIPLLLCAGAVAVLFGALAVVHNVFANRIAANAMPVQDRLVLVLRFMREYLCGVAGGGHSTAVVAGVAIAWLALLLTGSPRTRFLFAWSAVALFPYVFHSGWVNACTRSPTM